MAASLSFAKIVAHPTETAWSQVYHAGNLFALVSLTTDDPKTDLNSLGKEMFNALESNFFSLEKKTVATISDVIEESLKELPQEIAVSACIAFSKEAILYLFLVGHGDIIMKREEKIGVIVTRKEHDHSKKPLSSSGYLSHGDVLLMQTGSFAKLMSYDQIKDALGRHLPNDIAETLGTATTDMPGDAAAVILLYQGASSPDALTPAQEMRQAQKEASPLEETKTTEETAETKQTNALKEDEMHDEKALVKKNEDHEESKEEAVEKEEDDADENEETGAKNSGDEEKTLAELAEDEQILEKNHSPFDEEKEMRAWKTDHEDDDTPSPTDVAYQEDLEATQSPVTVTKRPRLKLPSKRILLGLVALLLVVALIFSIFFTKQSKESNQTKAVYDQVYTEASKKYDEAEGLKNLNATLAQDDYKKAAAMIRSALPKVKEGSEEEQKLKALLAKIEPNIENTEGATTATKAVDISESPLLSLAIDTPSSYVTSDDDKFYAITSKAVFEGEKELIKNDDDWKTVAGLGAYNGNVYVLDKDDGVLKFTAGSDGYGKSLYFSDGAPTLTNAVSMAIDGSIYLLFSDGSVKKYTKGRADSFTLSALPSPLRSPKAIVTSVDMDNIYILDSGNSRIVSLNKDGKFQKAWKTDALNGASLIDVQEKDKKIYILKGKNLLMMNME